MTRVTVGPFQQLADAKYWGGGVIAEDRRGGFWSLGFIPHPNGIDIYSVGVDTATGRPRSLDGWPKNLRRRHYVGKGDGGNGYQIYVEDDA